jgi:hypothetical protein
MIGCKNNSSLKGKVIIANKLHKNIVCFLGYNYPDLKLNFTNKQKILANLKRFEIDTDQSNEVDTIGLCQKGLWNKYIKQNLLMLFVFDRDKLKNANKLEDALIERRYYSFSQLMKVNGVITVE